MGSLSKGRKTDVSTGMDHFGRPQDAERFLICLKHLGVSMYICYIYVDSYIYREREREMYVYVCIFTCIYVFSCHWKWRNCNL